MRTEWFSARAIRLHLTLVALDTAFLLLGRWQLERALDGNGLSWAYTFEWPLFAVYAVAVWWHILHNDRPVRRRTPSARAAANDARAEAERTQYNAYLAALHESESTEPESTPKVPE